MNENRDLVSDQSPAELLKSKVNVADHELIRVIGRGAYGEVWLARHSKLGTLRAIKIVRRDQFSEGRPFRRGLPNFLFQNTTNGNFVRLMTGPGAPNLTAHSLGCAWADYEGAGTPSADC